MAAISSEGCVNAGSQRTVARCAAALTRTALTPATPASKASIVPAQAAQYMPDSCSVDSPSRSPPAPLTQRVKRACSTGSSRTASSVSGRDGMAVSAETVARAVAVMDHAGTPAEPGVQTQIMYADSELAA